MEFFFLVQVPVDGSLTLMWEFVWKAIFHRRLKLLKFKYDRTKINIKHKLFMLLQRKKKKNEKKKSSYIIDVVPLAYFILKIKRKKNCQ